MFTRKELQFPSEPQSTGNIESDIRGWLRYFYDVRKSIQDFFRWLNTPGAINLTQSKIENCQIEDTTIGATTASSGKFTTLTTSSTVTHNGGTANGVAYLNASKVLTTGSALVFDGTNLGIGISPSSPLDALVAADRRLLFRERSTGYAVIDAVNAANSAYKGFLFGGSEFYFQLNGSTLGAQLTSTGLGIGVAPNEKCTVEGALSIKDGMTAPSATSGYAKIYVDTADGDLKVIFGDGTVKTIVVDT